MDRFSVYSDDEILQIVIDKFGTTNEPYKGSSFILPNGMFLDLRNYKSHSDVEKYLIDNGYSDYPYNKTTGSPTLKDLGCIRINVDKYYVMYPIKEITKEQLQALSVWLEFLSQYSEKVEVIKDGISTTYLIER